MPAPIPYMQFYVADYLADTPHLDTEEHGAYFLIMLNYWQTGKPIPPGRLRKIARLSNERWTDVEQVLNEFFQVDENGHWYHPRIEAELAKVRAKSIKRSDAGKKSAEKRRLQAIENNSDSNKCSTTVQQTDQQVLNHTDTDTDTDIKKDVPKGTSKKKPTTKKKDPDVIYPPELNAKAWDEYKAYRANRKISPLKKISEAKKIEELSKFTHDIQQRAIDQTIANGWQGIFPDKIATSSGADRSFIDRLVDTDNSQ